MDQKIIITIGRQFGSGGVEVANELSKRLGFPVYDKELIAKAAQDSGFSPDHFEKNDEKKSLFSFSSLFSSESYMSDSALFNMQCETIRNIAEQESAIIVGRCSDYVLRDMPNVINVFLTGSLEDRAQRVMRRDGLNMDEAISKIEKKDKNRSEYYNYYTFGNWGVASTYHLCIDTSIFGIKGTADIIMNALNVKGVIDAEA